MQGLCKINFKKFHFSKKQVLLVLLSIFVLSILAFFVHVLYVKNNGDILSGIYFSSSYEDRNGNLIQVFLTEDDKYRVYKNVSEYPQEFIDLLLTQEDKFFYSHNGINIVSIFKAFNETYIKKSRRIGASTITMQVAKLKYNLYTKNIGGKLLQIIFALYLEMCFSKQEILDAYVNLVPCGKNIEGFESASWYYFSKPIEKLSLSENIMLCVLPQNPTKRAPEKFKTPSELINARKVLFNNWIKEHPEDADKKNYMDMKINTVCDFPNEAIHFTQMLAQQENINLKDEKKIRQVKKTTIDLSLQKQCEEFLESHIAKHKSFGVHNGGLLLLDWQNMEVLANIGSLDFYNNEIQGQVNITTSKRSPGSTLKPFIYALALEQGLIHYRTMLKDTPQAFNEYAPDNYGNTFKGPVQAWFALADSRNIPAVSLAQQIQNPDLYDFLQSANISNLKSKEHYGLSIVLGSAEVTMLELTKLYAMLANNGKYKNIKFYKEGFATKNLSSEDFEKQLLTEESAFIVRKMLEANVPPVSSIPIDLKNIPIGYKTGTSIGFKDSWTVGFFDKYILCIWIGNFDGQGNNSFLGRRMSAPLFFEIAYSILSQMNKQDMILVDWPPRKVSEIEVCSVSGSIPTENCEKKEKTYFIPGTSPIEKCKIHRKINIDLRTGYRTDEADKQYVKTVIREFWPSDLQILFEQAGLPRLIPPSYPPESFNMWNNRDGFPPQILSPMTGTDYVYRTKDENRNKIILEASSDADSSELIWFCGSDFITRTKPNEVYEWNCPLGKHEITVVDSKGRSCTVNVNVILQGE